MKKSILIVTILSLALFFMACGNNTGAINSSGENLLKFIPDNATGFMNLDVKAISSFDIFKKFEEDFKPNKNFKNYEEFVAKTGIDPKKDISGAAVGFFMSNFTNAKSVEYISVIGVKYDKEKLLKFATENSADFKETVYNGKKLYNITENGKTQSVYFADAKHIIIASKDSIKNAVDLFDGKGKSILDNANAKKYLGMLDSKSMFSMVFNIPKELRVKKNVGMGEVDFTKAEAFIASAWRADNAYNIEMKLISNNKEANDKLAGLLNMFKGFGASQPDYKELIDSIQIDSNAEMLQIHLSITDSFLNKMKEKAKSFIGNKMSQTNNMPDMNKAPEEDTQK